MKKKLLIIAFIILLVLISIFIIIKSNSSKEDFVESSSSNVTFEKNETTGNYIVYDKDGDIIKDDVSESERYVYEDFPDYSPGF